MVVTPLTTRKSLARKHITTNAIIVAELTRVHELQTSIKWHTRTQRFVSQSHCFIKIVSNFFFARCVWFLFNSFLLFHCIIVKSTMWIPSSLVQPQSFNIEILQNLIFFLIELQILFGDIKVNVTTADNFWYVTIWPNGEQKVGNQRRQSQNEIVEIECNLFGGRHLTNALELHSSP